MIRRFNRYELKYVIPVWKARLMIAELKRFAVPDEHAGESGYPLVSLYYDSPDLDFFWTKVDGLKYRRKVRIRIYPEANIEDTTHGMVEIKQRTNRTVQKRRLNLPLDAAQRLCAGVSELDDLQALDALDREVASEVLYLSRAMHLRPSAVTAYHRIAYVGSKYDQDVRITFDMQLSGRVHALRVHESARNHLLLSADWCVLEVKSNDAVPDWVGSLLTRHHCELRRVSKYCATIAHLKHLHDRRWALARRTLDTSTLEIQPTYSR